MTTQEARVRDAWSSIDAFVTPTAARELYAPASPEEIERLRSTLAGLDLPLPDELAASLACHDGVNVRFQDEKDCWQPMSVTEIVQELEIMRDLALDFAEMQPDAPTPPEMSPGWWLQRWIPVATTGGGDFLCIDYAPSKAGVRGQVIRYYRSSCVGRGVESRDYAGWLESIAKSTWRPNSRNTFIRVAR